MSRLNPKSKIFGGGLLSIFTGYLIFFYSYVPITRVVIDPGHGGINPLVNGEVVRSERWDELTQKFVSFYGEGMSVPGYREADVVYPLAQRVQQILNWTQHPIGWLRFQKLLREISDQKEFPRMLFQSILTHPENQTADSHSIFSKFVSWPWQWAGQFDKTRTHKIDSPLWAPFFEEGSYLNDMYRLYDFRDMRGRMRHGRFSKINAFAPSLVVSLHMTPGGNRTGGMAAVLTPGFSTLNMVREIHLGKRSYQEWIRSPWKDHILQVKGDIGQSKYRTFRSDIWGYFHGFRSLSDGLSFDFQAKRGLRHNLISWAYQEKNWALDYDYLRPEYSLTYQNFEIPKQIFWEREQSIAEEWRREGGRLGFGGDNHSASDELMRFIRAYAIPQQGTGGTGSNNFASEPGEIASPYVSTYALPVYVNAVVAFLEIGSLDVLRDQKFILENKEMIARAIAVGIYSLYQGLRFSPNSQGQKQCQFARSTEQQLSDCGPTGLPIHFEKYENMSLSLSKSQISSEKKAKDEQQLHFPARIQTKNYFQAVRPAP